MDKKNHYQGVSNEFPFIFKEELFVLYYKGNDGTVSIDKWQQNTNVVNEVFISRWRTGITSILPIIFDEHLFVMVYAAGDGYFEMIKFGDDLKSFEGVWNDITAGFSSLIFF